MIAKFGGAELIGVLTYILLLNIWPIESVDQQNKSLISSHVLDITEGFPSEGVECLCFFYDPGTHEWMLIGTVATDSTGMVENVAPAWELRQGTYKIRFLTHGYFSKKNRKTFFPYIEVVFNVEDASQKYHVPLTLSDFGYSTYRGQ